MSSILDRQDEDTLWQAFFTGAPARRRVLSRLPVEETAEKRKRFKTYEIGYAHIDSCERRHADGRFVMFLAIDRVSKFTYVEFHEGAAFLQNVAEVLATSNIG